jgi:hypothetical protein
MGSDDNDLVNISIVFPDGPRDEMRDEVQRNVFIDFRGTARHAVILHPAMKYAGSYFLVSIPAGIILRSILENTFPAAYGDRTRLLNKIVYIIPDL